VRRFVPEGFWVALVTFLLACGGASMAIAIVAVQLNPLVVLGAAGALFFWGLPVAVAGGLAAGVAAGSSPGAWTHRWPLLGALSGAVAVSAACALILHRLKLDAGMPSAVVALVGACWGGLVGWWCRWRVWHEPPPRRATRSHSSNVGSIVLGFLVAEILVTWVLWARPLVDGSMSVRRSALIWSPVTAMMSLVIVTPLVVGPVWILARALARSRGETARHGRP
jgi:hypothetical protein